MGRGTSRELHGIDPRRRGRAASSVAAEAEGAPASADARSPLPVPALYEQGQSEWDQGLCAEYACALQQLHPGLQLGVVGEQTEDGWNAMHVIAHDQRWGYDVTGARPLSEIEEAASAVGVQFQIGFSGPEAVQTTGAPLIQYPDEVDRARRLIEAVTELRQGDRQQRPEPIELVDADLRQALEELAATVGLSEREDDVLGYYSGDEIHGIVNDWLRGRELTKAGGDLARRYIAEMDQIFENAPRLTEPARVYRGIKDAPELIASLDKGHALEPGYLSTAIDRDRALSFCRRRGEDQAEGEHGTALLEIEIPAGTHLLPIHEIVSNLPYGTEEEILLPRGGYLVLDKVDRSGPVPEYRVRYLAD